MILNLTPEQEAKFPEYVARWTSIGLSTAPADRPRAEAAIRWMYEQAGLDEPKITWCASPLAMSLTAHTLLTGAPQGWTRWGGSVRESVWGSVGDSVGRSVGSEVMAEVGASVRDSVRDAAWDSVAASVRASVWAPVGASVRDSVGDAAWDSVWDAVGGQHEAGWLSFYEYMRDVVGLAEQTAKLHGLWELAKSAGWIWPRKGLCLVSERPTALHRDSQGRLHCEDGPAITYPDGWAIYAIHGVRVPEQVVMKPSSLQVEQIDREANVEVRRVMMDRFGTDRYILESGTEPVAMDDYGVLYRRDIAGDEPLVMVKVVNSTPEPDGSFRDYWLRVPPTMTTPREAVAWTFGVEAEEYAPEIQT